MSENLRVLSWNLHFKTFAKDNSYVLDTLEKLQLPDVVCLQEFADGGDGRLQEWFASHDYETTYLPFASKGQFSQGVMTATRKVLEATTQPVVLRDDPAGKVFRRFPNKRGLLNTHVTLDGVAVSVNNFHSTYPRPHVIDKRRREFAALITFLEAEEKELPLLLCGDFNFFGRDERRKILKDRFEYFTGTLADPTWRHHSRYSPIRVNLDYFFWKGLSVKAELLPFSGSDHRPLLASVTMQ